MSAEAVERRHGQDCQCTRCRGFQPGEVASVRHGAYSRLRLGSRAEEIADVLRAIVPAGSIADEPTIDLCAIVLARCEAAERALAQLDEVHESNPIAVYLSNDRDKLERLRQDLRGWLNQALRYLEVLGLSPRSRAALGLQLRELQRLDLERLTVAEKTELTRILTKAGGVVPEVTSGA